MKTTLETILPVLGWQGGTIHQAMAEFTNGSEELKNKICGALADNISNISDPRNALWFTRNRMGA